MIRIESRQLLAGLCGLMILLPFAYAGEEQSKNTQKEIDTLNACLVGWGQHPFKKIKPGSYKVVKGGVSIAGMGDDISDAEKTASPKLILVKPSVNILAATNYNLMNPNGWYCLRGQVNVLGTAKIKLACTAKLRSSSGGTTILGKSEGKAGTTVLGNTTITRNCDSNK